MATNYDIDYNDQRFAKVESDKSTAMNQVDSTYDGMIDQSDKFYDQQIQASKDWANQQSQMQQEQTDFTIEQIEQQKDQAEKDYIKEQSGSYVDWKKQSNSYGAESEKMASAGLANTGYSESSQVSMYNTYQNRVASARETYNRAVLNYDNAIKDARLQNSAILAEIAYNALQQQLDLSLQGFQYKNSLIIDKANKKMELDNTFYNRYLDVLSQINTENAMAEEVRQFNESMNFQREQFEEEKRQYNESASRSRSGGGSGGGGGGYQADSGTGDGTDNKTGKQTFEQAVMSLGKGPLTGEAVDQLVAQGKAKITYSEDKGWTATKTKDTKTAGQNILDNYTLINKAVPKLTGQIGNWLIKSGGGGKKF